MNLKVLRVMANLTQAEAAKKVGIAQSVLSDWERGQYKPSAASVSRLAEAYGVSEAKILKGIELTVKAEKKTGHSMSGGKEAGNATNET